MSQPSTVKVLQGKRRAGELGDTLINPSDALSSTVLLNTAAGARFYLPAYRSAAQTSSGSTALQPSVTDDGLLTFFLESVPAPEIAGTVDGATPCLTGTTFTLVVNQSGGGTRIPFDHAYAGGAVHRLSVKLAANQAKVVRAALFDINPNVAIEIAQTLQLAARQTPAFVQSNWSNPAIRSGLVGLFNGIPFSEPSIYSQMAAASDPDFPNQYLVLNCVYTAQVSAPQLPGYVQWQVNWHDRAYNYYQDNQDPSRVFYLPDQFAFDKGPKDAPTVSLLQFSLPAGGTTVEATRAHFRIYGRPVVDLERINNAAQSLKAKLGQQPQMVSLQDAHKVKLRFTQYLPNAAATGSDPAVQMEASIDLAEGLRNELDMNFAQFTALWAAIFSGAPENPLFRGWVDVELSDGRYADRIDFNARLPTDREKSFFDDIIETGTTNTYPAEFSVRTAKGVFSDMPDVAELLLIFAIGKTIAFVGDAQKKTITAERSIRDIVIGNQKPDEYPYRLMVVRQDGSKTCSECTAKTDMPSIWITKDQVAHCTGPCA
ncbi:hypothetical protein ACVWWK_003327 [Bradyrhizobium sp. LB9.1b]